MKLDELEGKGRQESRDVCLFAGSCVKTRNCRCSQKKMY